MKQWLRDNPQHIPEGTHPDASNSIQLRSGLQRNGWEVKETDSEVHLIFPGELRPTHLRRPSELRRHSKNYFVVLSENEKYPMMEWLRVHLEYLPEGRHPDTHTSRQLRSDLERSGWEVKETDSEVHLIFPDEDGASDEETPNSFPLNEEDHVETPSAFALEQHLRDYIAKDIHKISFNGGNLKLFQDQDGRKGVEYPTDTGRIDILAVSADDNEEFFVIELKLSRGSDQAIGQLMRYMSWVEDKIAAGKKVNGIIVAQSIDDRLRRSASMLCQVELFEYELQFNLRSVSSAN